MKKVRNYHYAENKEEYISSESDEDSEMSIDNDHETDEQVDKGDDMETYHDEKSEDEGGQQVDSVGSMSSYHDDNKDAEDKDEEPRVFDNPSKRNAWGLLVYSIGNGEQYVRVRRFRSGCKQ